jgi:hypothetical protein
MNPAIPPWVQYVWAAAGITVALGGVVWILFIFWPYLRWSKAVMRESLEIGKRTAAHLDQLQNELTPVIEDLRTAVADAKDMLHELRGEHFDRMVKAVESIPQKIDELAKKAEAKAISKMVDSL